MSDGISDGFPFARRSREELLSALEEAERFGQHRTQEVVDLTADLATERAARERAERERDEAQEHARRSQADRAAVLNVKSKDGLLSSEWLMRTAHAEKDRDAAESRVRALTGVMDECKDLAQRRGEVSRLLDTLERIEARCRAALAAPPSAGKEG